MKGQIGLTQPSINHTNDELLCIFGLHYSYLVCDFNQSDLNHSIAILF